MGEPCRKCKSWRPLPGDTWCIGCSAWETVGLELVGQWNGPVGLRSIANDLVLNCAREVRALRAVGAGFGRAPAASGASQPAQVGPARDPSPKPLSTSAKVKPSEPESEYTYEEESEDEGPKEVVDKRPALLRRTPPPQAGAVGDQRASGEGVVKEELPVEERRDKVRGEEKQKRPREEGGKRDHHRSEKERKEKKDKEKKKKKKKRRGGRKHQRLHTLGEDPYRAHHRRLSGAILDDRDNL